MIQPGCILRVRDPRGVERQFQRRARNVQFFLLREWVVAAGREGEPVARVAQLGAERAGDEDVCDAEGQRRWAVGVVREEQQLLRDHSCG